MTGLFAFGGFPSISMYKIKMKSIQIITKGVKWHKGKVA